MKASDIFNATKKNKFIFPLKTYLWLIYNTEFLCTQSKKEREKAGHE